MDEGERQTKLKAGKEALLAYQQKKKKKGRSKKRTETPNDVDTNAYSEPPSLLVGTNQDFGLLDSLGDNDSPVPPDESGLPAGGNPLSLPDLSSQMSTSLPIVSHIPSTTTSHTPLASDHAHQPHPLYNEEPDGTLESHNPSHLPTDAPLSPQVIELEQQIAALSESKQKLQNELNSVLDQNHHLQDEILQIRKNQENAIEIAKRDTANMFESKLASIQYSLVQSEAAQQDLEKKLLDSQSNHSQEVESLLRREEEVRATMLEEKDRKHAEHIARLTERFASQMETPDGPRDSDEQEAERLKLIKLKMREMFDAEKQQLLAAHQQEKVAIEQEAQKRIEDYRTQTEQLANAKLQELHSQFMSAHQALSEQKNQSDALVAELGSKLESLQQDQSQLLQERMELQQRYDQLSESHLAELEKARHASNGLESRLNDWKDKASKLEARLHKSESESQNDLDNLREENTTALERLKEEYEDRLKGLQQLVDDYQHKLADAESKYEVLSEGLRVSQQEVETVKQSHTSEVDALNQSIRDLTQDRGSLEVAEEHMMSVQKQLENYRKQELNYQNQLDDKEREYRDGLNAYKQQFEEEKDSEIEQITAKFDMQIKTLEEELASVTASVESGDAERKRLEKIESLRSKHKKRVSELESIHEQALRGLREQLEQSHSKEINTLNRQHSEKIARLKEVLTQQSELEKTQLVQEMEASKQSELQRLVEEHKVSVEQATQSLTAEFATRSEERISRLEDDLKASREECSQVEAIRKDLLSQLELAQRQNHDLSERLKRTHIEMERLSQDCDRYQNKSKSLEVDLSISQSAHEQDKQRLGALEQEVSVLQSQKEKLMVELGESRKAESASAQSEEALSRLTNDLATKNVAIADLQAQNDSLNTEVFSLTQKCQELVTKSSALQEQLETSWGANEEIESLKNQVSELLQYKDDSARLKEKIEMLEEGLKSKDEAVMSLESQLEQATQYVTEMNAKCSALEKAVTESSREIDSLQLKVAMKDGQEKELQRMVGEFERQVSDLAAVVKEKEAENRELSNTVSDLNAQLSTVTDKVTELQECNSRLEDDLQHTQQSLSTALKDDFKEPYENLQEDFERQRQEKIELSIKLSSFVEHQKELRASWQTEVAELKAEIQTLEGKLVDKEAELARVKTESEHKLKEAELREKTLLQSKPVTTPTKGKLGRAVKEKSALEETLIRARQTLTEKLAEKAMVEKELSLHQAQLERRLSEKQHLEEVLVEKSRFEQELQNQKEQLKVELEAIESKLKLKEVDGEKNDLLGKVREKDGFVDRRNKEHEHKSQHKTRRKKQVKERL